MTDLVNPQDKVVVVAGIIEKEDMLVSIAHVMCALFESFSTFSTIIPIRASKVGIL